MTKEIETLKQEIKVLEKKLSLLEELENQKLLPKMKLSQTGTIDDIEYNGLRYFRIDFNYYSYPVWWEHTEKNDSKMQFVADKETKEHLEFDYNNLIKEREKKLVKQNLKKSLQELSVGEVKPIDEVIKEAKKENSKPAKEVFDRLDDKYEKYDGTSYITDDVVDRLVKKYQAQKLYHRLFEIGYDKEDCDIILSIIEDWIPEPQSSSGSQNVNTELLVDGFNDCLREMKEMLR